ncbi:DUF6461 domain-containing protein [Streptosporangium sp. 'caverna']|uniref:DUF6461 domain-containing protein n=1 Tax=Streptosporangium sp. 'caverna' TaxID=2202249 RepID=UPI000D7E392B|nr:DUF6461 domain-containing protein [Streptosporangium sp. 'caverna']AWS40348.1 hypothetical protein DKM19_02360 [Streptosporangium sp. 'caverna']
MADPLAPFRWLGAFPGDRDDLLGEIFCVSFFHRLEPVEVLHRFGTAGRPGREMTFHELAGKVWESIGMTDDDYVGVVQVGEWSVAVELRGQRATLAEPLSGLSRGCEVVAIMRHDHAEDRFVYAVDGEVVTSFTPHLPDTRWGSDPDRINELMRETGLPPETLDEEAWEATWDDMYTDRISRVFSLAAKITDVVFTPSILDGPLLVSATSQ